MECDEEIFIRKINDLFMNGFARSEFKTVTANISEI